MVPAWALAATALVACVEISMPSVAVIAQEGCGLGMGRTLPSRSGMATSTRHWRQLAEGPSRGWSQKRGMRTPICSAARMSSVPLATSTGTPSIVMLTISVMTHLALSRMEEAR